MKILLDECVPWPLHKLLPGHTCLSAVKCGWGGVKNGDLIRLAEPEFELFITADQNIRYQQNLMGRKIAILELSTNNLRVLERGIENIRSAVSSISRGEYRHLDVC
jgi:predicted nuclease of predicted toxin-antitoxin system